MFQIEQYKIWKGIDPTRPEWSGLNLVGPDRVEMEELMAYLQRNNPERVYRVIERT